MGPRGTCLYVHAGGHAAACSAGAYVVANGTVYVCTHAGTEMGYTALLHVSHMCVSADLAGGGWGYACARQDGDCMGEHVCEGTCARQRCFMGQVYVCADAWGHGLCPMDGCRW